MSEENQNGITIQIDVPEIVERLLPRLAALLDRFDGDFLQNKEQTLPDEILTIDELCALFKIPKTKGYAMTMKTGPGSIPRFKIGRYLRFKRSEVIPWFESQRIK